MVPRGGDGGGAFTSFWPDGQPGGICSSPTPCFATAYAGTQTGPGAGESEAVTGHIDGAPGSGHTGGAAGATTGGGGGGGGWLGGAGGGTTRNGTGDGGGGGGSGSTFANAVLTNRHRSGSAGGQWPRHRQLHPSGGVGVSLACAGAAGKTCTGQVAVSVRERRRGKKIVAVLARAKTKTVPVVVGKAKYSITAGSITVVEVTLNRSGRALLERFHHLRVKVRVSVATTNGLSQTATKTVTIKARRNGKRK